MKFAASISCLSLAAGTLAAPDHQQQPLVRPSATDDYKIPKIPRLGFGTWNLRISDENTTDAVAAAIKTGYPHIDCAAAYSNQKAVGEGIAKGLKSAGRKRSDIWVTSKLWNDHHDPSKVEQGLNTTLEDLGLDYLDLYLMHWPVGTTGASGKLQYDYVDTWHAMEKLLKLGTVRQIGVCNFSPGQLRELVSKSSVKPAVHQMELHPYLQQKGWVAFHQRHGIEVTAYSPLGDTNPTYHSVDEPPRLLSNKILTGIGEKRNCTAAQVSLAWNIARDVVVIPKSSHVEYIEENLATQECALSWSDLRKIDAIEESYVKRFNNPSKGWGVHLFEGLDDN